MKKKLLDGLETKQLLRMNVQRFEGEGAAGEGGDVTPPEGGQQTNPDDKGSEKTFTKAQLATATEQAREALRNEMETKHQQELEEARKAARTEVTEAKKYEQMTDEEKRVADLERKERESIKRERELTVRELTAEAKDTLNEKKLPSKLSALLDYTDSDSLNNSIKLVEETFNELVQAETDKRIADSARTPGGGGGGSKADKAGSIGSKLAAAKKQNAAPVKKSFFD